MKVKVNVKLGDEEREVEFTANPLEPSKFMSARVFAARIGRGSKMHRTNGRMTLYPSIEEAKAKGGESILYVTDRGVLALHLETTLRRKPALIVGWANNYAGTDMGSKQRYYGSLY